MNNVKNFLISKLSELNNKISDMELKLYRHNIQNDTYFVKVDESHYTEDEEFERLWYKIEDEFESLYPDCFLYSDYDFDAPEYGDEINFTLLYSNNLDI